MKLRPFDALGARARASRVSRSGRLAARALSLKVVREQDAREQEWGVRLVGFTGIGRFHSRARARGPARGRSDRRRRAYALGRRVVRGRRRRRSDDDGGGTARSDGGGGGGGALWVRLRGGGGGGDAAARARGSSALRATSLGARAEVRIEAGTLAGARASY